eukprot:3036704-Alexandrium_andersonii.AAC.1
MLEHGRRHWDLNVMELVGWAAPAPALRSGEEVALPALSEDCQGTWAAPRATSPRAESAGDEPEPNDED